MTDAAQPWESKLTSVTVYARGAVCRRLARGVVAADGRVRVSGLPRALDPESLRATVVDAQGVRVTEARIAVEAEPHAPDAPRELLREAQRLSDAQQAAEARRDRQARRIEEIAALRPVPPARRREDPHRRTPVEAWLGLAEFVDERSAALQAGLAGLDEEVRRLTHELDLATDRLERASTDAPSSPVRTSVSAVLTLEGAGSEGAGSEGAGSEGAGSEGAGSEGSEPEGAGAAAVEIEVEVEYRVPGAVWAPSYRLTRRQGEDGGRLVLRASVAQRTGEDWRGVRISLSTADLSRPTGVPALRSVRIGRRQPPPAPSGWREPPPGLAALFAGYDTAEPPPFTPRHGAPTASGGFAEEWSGSIGSASVVAAPSPPRAARSRAGGMPKEAPAALPFAGAPAAPAPPGGPAAAPPPSGYAAAPPPPPPGPPRPGADELDYAGLVLSGPDAPAGQRGLLVPGTPGDPVAAEYRRRAESVGSLPLPGHAVRPRDSAGSFDHRYDAQGLADIPSDGTWHTVTVTELAVGLRTEYLCVPSVEETVYATLVLTNATDQALLAGPVDITADGEHLPTTALPTLAPGGTGRVALGPAEAIRASRRTELRESTSGLRGTTTVLDHRILVELASRLSRPATVEVRERVPVTSESDIRIDERGGWTTPRDGGDGPERFVPGTRLWRVDVPAGGTASLDGGYEIRIPAAKALTGGNRRS
ncbi:DUF4139 domain-containing protein [Streptomyces kunmingensis]|uniref:DUF4139 domain-containing protein n=1 Tax=Streptomyces kunmingensis TaxID=68225 RepID=A0ABU6CQ55_9ACTN|nr:DUF4139 domain-containing protein [Streptomyces kunmingensis]MEB3966869.1 DUF4139 domain-containing protein [Streptomyces kunmingensis]